MNTKIAQLLVVVAVGVFGSTAARAQFQADWDPLQSWGGGDGQWDSGVSTDWSAVNANSGTGYSWNDSNNRNTVESAYFGSAPGTITVDDSQTGGNVEMGIMEFNSGSQSGNWVITGDTLYQIEPAPSATLIQVDAGTTANVTIDSAMIIGPNPSNGSSVINNNAVGTTLTLNNITVDGSYEAQTGTNQSMVTEAANGTTIAYNGTLSAASGYGIGLLFGYYGTNSTGVYQFNGDLAINAGTGKLFDFASGQLMLGTSNMGTGQFCFVGNGNSDSGAYVMPILTNVAGLDITNSMYAQSRSNSQIGSAVAGNTTFSGNIGTGGGAGNLDLYATSGATVTFSGNLYGDNAYTSKSGAGTVILSNAGGNTWTTYTPDAFEMKEGTTIITNTTGDAFGNGAANGGVGAVFVQLDAGAKLAGTGITAQTLKAVGATSEISPGLSSSIGSLTLGGLTTTSGLTMDFKLNGEGTQYGVNNDFLYLQGALSLGGTVTINLSAMDALLTGDGNYYTLFSAGGTVTGAPTFDVIAPAGYALDSSYGNGVGGGYDYNPVNGTFRVELVATPEPSTYGLMGLGLLALVAIGRWLRRGQSI
jgi:hypothetical protein